MIYRPAPILRLRPTPDDPATGFAEGPRPRGSRRPHGDAKVAAVRRLIEETALSYGEIAARTGVGRASICRWTRDGGWQRPPGAPPATDRVPRARASLRFKLRLLAERLRALAERQVRALEATESPDIGRLMQALQVLKMARLEAMGRRRRRGPPDETPRTGAELLSRQEAIRMALRELHRGGIDVDAAPQEALDMVIEARLPVDDHPMVGRRR